MSTPIAMFIFSLFAVTVGLVMHLAGYRILAFLCWMATIGFVLYMASLL